MTHRIDPQLKAEAEARELALAQPLRTPAQLAAAHRRAAAAESRKLLDMMAERDALSGAERDRLTREINESREWIERRLASAAEIEAVEQLQHAAE